MVRFEVEPGTNTLVCCFECERMDSTTATEVGALVAGRLDSYLAGGGDGACSVCFDLHKVSYVSSLFLRVVVQTAKRVPRGGLAIRNANKFIVDLFRTSGMDKVAVMAADGSGTEHETVVDPPPDFVAAARISSREEYACIHRLSLEDPERYWAAMASEHLHWDTGFERVLEWEDCQARWFAGGKLNASANCLDRHLGTAVADKRAIVWEGESCSPDQAPEIRELTYRQLHAEVQRFAGVLKNNGIVKGDRVLLYMPMVPEAVVAMLACARIGAVHSVVFAGFSPQSVAERVQDCGAKAILTVDGSYRRGRLLELKRNVDEALCCRDADGVCQCASVSRVIVHRYAGNPVTMVAGRDVWWQDEIASAPADCPPESMDSEDVLFILYTSGSTGKPKGIVHTTAGYLLGTRLTHCNVFDIRDDDVYWCTADIGWITGHSYVVYGPLANGTTVFMYEGAPDYPDPGRFWQMVERHRITILYTAPTAIRAFMKWGEQWPQGSDLSSLRLLGTVGEPINPHAWEWYFRHIGVDRCPIVDTWWQTETGAIMISSLPGAIPMKPGSAAVPFFGVDAAVVDEHGAPVEPGEDGFLVVNRPWPSMLRGIWNDPERYRQTYWADLPGRYATGDGARVDAEGYFWVIGRVDDVINVSGHRVGTAEIENAMVNHPAVAEAAVVSRPDDLKGSVVVVFATLMPGIPHSPELQRELARHVASEVGAFARPEEVRFIDALPKTRSGKIMRRFLKQIAAGTDVTGDTSTLEDLDSLMKLLE
jgi:acetyl-CoA synthetase